MVGHGGSSAVSYLANPTSPIPSHCASIVTTSTLKVNCNHLHVPLTHVTFMVYCLLVMFNIHHKCFKKQSYDNKYNILSSFLVDVYLTYAAIYILRQNVNLPIFLQLTGSGNQTWVIYQRKKPNRLDIYYYAVSSAMNSSSSLLYFHTKLRFSGYHLFLKKV